MYGHKYAHTYINCMHTCMHTGKSKCTISPCTFIFRRIPVYAQVQTVSLRKLVFYLLLKRMTQIDRLWWYSVNLSSRCNFSLARRSFQHHLLNPFGFFMLGITHYPLWFKRTFLRAICPLCSKSNRSGFIRFHGKHQSPKSIRDSLLPSARNFQTKWWDRSGLNLVCNIHIFTIYDNVIR